jgi:serine/threonine-protein kinase
LRKHAPERVIAWNRLLAGDWRDPLVGRDILIGGVIGLGFMASAVLRYQIPLWLGEPPHIPYGISNPGGSALLGARGFPVLFLNQVAASLIFGFMISFLILFFSLLLRRKLFGSAAVWLLIFIFGIAGDISGGQIAGGIVYSILFPTTLVWTASRFGVLATVSNFTFYHLIVFYPVTSELSAWYAGDFVLCAGVLIALAFYGFYTSLAGEKLFQTDFFNEA